MLYKKSKFQDLQLHLKHFFASKYKNLKMAVASYLNTLFLCRIVDPELTLNVETNPTCRAQLLYIFLIL